jgi:HAMP domain-containing protein
MSNPLPPYRQWPAVLPLEDGLDLSASQPDAPQPILPDLIGAPNPYRRSLWSWWLRLTMPPMAPTLNPRLRERLRRARLLSTLLFAVTIVVLALIPKGLFPIIDPGTLGGIAIVLPLNIVVAVLNRTGHITTAGTIFVITVAAAIAWSLIATPNGLGMQDLPTFDLFVAPVVMAGALLPRQTSIYIWLGCTTFTILDLLYEVHQPNLSAYIAQVSVYGVAIIPIILSGVLAVVSWLAAGSVQRAIAEADRTVELEHANQLITSQKQRLEEAISVIQSVHARVANGDLSARAPVAIGELAPLAVSLNLMLERLARSSAAESLLGGLEQQVQRLTAAAAQMAQGQLGYPVPQQKVGQLSPLAHYLEQVRMGILGIVHTADQRVLQVEIKSLPLISVVLRISTLVSAREPIPRDILEQASYSGQELREEITRLRRYFARFTV